jgi:hypothetical protein
MKFDLTQYEPVEARLERFWAEHPEGRIETRLLTDPAALDEVVIWAGAWFHAADEHPAGTGHASERRGGTGANQFAHLENAETSSIGRALCNCGYKARRESPRPSREEMTKVQRPDSAGDRQAPVALPGDLHAHRFPPAHPRVAPAESNREALIAEVHTRFKALHVGEKFYPWAAKIVGRPVSQISDLEYSDLDVINQHLGTEQETLAALDVPAAPEPTALLKGAE